MKHNQNFGKWGEETAASFLVNQGLVIIEKNWKCVFGEIDIVAKKENLLVFVEVKTRKDDQFGLPEEAITAPKRQHLIHASMVYIDEHQIKDEWRIDIISIRKRKGEKMEIEWFENAIQEND